MASRPFEVVDYTIIKTHESETVVEDEITVKKEWLRKSLLEGPTNGPGSLRIYREDVRALLITEFGGPISDLEVGLLLRQAFPKHNRKGKYYFGIGEHRRQKPIDVAFGLQSNQQSLVAVGDAGCGERPSMLKPMKKRAIEAWREENGRQKPDPPPPPPAPVPVSSPPSAAPPPQPEPIVRPWPHPAVPPPEGIPRPPLTPGISMPMDQNVWRQMLQQMKQPLPISPIDPVIRGPGPLRGYPPGYPPGLPPGLPGGTSMVPMVTIAKPMPISTMANMPTNLNNQAGVRVDNLLGLSRAPASRGRKRSVGMERSGGKRRRRPDEHAGMIDLSAAGGMTPHQKELSKIQPIILNFDVPVPKVSPTKPIEQRLEHIETAVERQSRIEEMRRNVHILPEHQHKLQQRPDGGNIPSQPGIVVTSYPDSVLQLHLPQPGGPTNPAPGHIAPPMQTDRGAIPAGGGRMNPFKKPDVTQFEAVTGAKCMICRLAIPPNSKDFPTRPGVTATCSRCKKVAFGGLKQKIEPIPKFPTACNAPLAEKMTKLRRAQAFVRHRSRVARQRATGIRGGKMSASAPSSPAPGSPMPPSPSSLPPRSPGHYMPRSPATCSLPPPSPSSLIPPHSPSGSLPPRSPNYLAPHSPGNLAPQSPGNLAPPSPGNIPSRSPGSLPPPSPGSLAPPSPGSYPRSPNASAKSPHAFQPRSPYCLQPRSPMSLPPRSPCSSMPSSPQPYSYPASPSFGARPPMSPVLTPRQAELQAMHAAGVSLGAYVGSLSEKHQAELANLRRSSGGGESLPSPRHPQLHEQSPSSSTSSERLSLPPGREQDDTTIRALLQLSRPATDSSGRPTVSSQGEHNPNNVPVMVLQRGAKPGSAVPHYPQPFMIPTSLHGELHTSSSSSVPGTPTMITTAGGHLIPVIPSSAASSLPNAIPPGYPTAALKYLVQPFSPGAIRYPNVTDKPSPRSSEMYPTKPGQPQYIPARSKDPNQPGYGSYMTNTSQGDTRPDSIVIVGTNCAGSSSITVGNDPKDNYIQVQPPPSLQDSSKLNDLYGKPGFHAFYCSCSGKRIMLLQCPDCDFLCNNLFGMELHIAAQRHAESRSKAMATDVHRYGRGDQETSSKYGADHDSMMHEKQDNDDMMSQSSVDTQSVDMDMEMASPRNSREMSHHDSDRYPSPSHDNWTERSTTSSSVISTIQSRFRRDSLASNPPAVNSSPHKDNEDCGRERSTPYETRSRDKEDETWTSQQEKCSRKSVLVSHRRGSITEGTPLDLSGYSRTSLNSDGRDLPTMTEAQYIRSCKLGNIGSVVERSVPLDLSGNPTGENPDLNSGDHRVSNAYSTPGQFDGKPLPSRPSSVQSNCSISSSVGSSLYPATIDLSRLQPTSLSNPIGSGRPPWPMPHSSLYAPVPSTTNRTVPPMTNPFLALSMHAARAKRAKESVRSSSSDTGTKTTTSSTVETSVPSVKLNIPAGVAAASTLSRPPTHTVNSTTNLPTTDLTRAPPGLMYLGGNVLNYQGGTISIGSAEPNPHAHVAARTVLFSGGEPQTPKSSAPDIRIKEEPRDLADAPSPCVHSQQNGEVDDHHHARSSPTAKTPEVRKSEPVVNKQADNSSHQESAERPPPPPPVTIKQEVTSAN